jgi:hypothetical protein
MSSLMLASMGPKIISEIDQTYKSFMFPEGSGYFDPVTGEKIDTTKPITDHFPEYCLTGKAAEEIHEKVENLGKCYTRTYIHSFPKKVIKLDCESKYFTCVETNATLLQGIYHIKPKREDGWCSYSNNLQNEEGYCEYNKVVDEDTLHSMDATLERAMQRLEHYNTLHKYHNDLE